MITFCAVLACFCSGIALSCAGVSIAKYLCKRPRPIGRFSAFCVSLSCAILFAALTVILMPSLDTTSPNADTVVYFCAFIVIGVLAGVWFRVAFPLIVFLYLCYALWSAAPLAAIFSAQGQFSIRVDSDSVIAINGERYEFAQNEIAIQNNSPDGFILVFELYSLPEKWLVPFRQRVFRLAGVAPRGNQQNILYKVNDFGTRNLFSILRTSFLQTLTASRTEEIIEMPAAEIYPVEYTLECAIQKQKLVTAWKKIL